MYTRATSGCTGETASTPAMSANQPRSRRTVDVARYFKIEIQILCKIQEQFDKSIFTAETIFNFRSKNNGLIFTK